MISRRIAILIVAGAAGCQHDVETIAVDARAGNPVELRVRDDLAETLVATFRWELVEAPANSPDVAPLARTSVVTVTPSRRGIYVYDRWIERELGDDLTNHFVVTVDGFPPEPRIAPVGTAKLHSTVALTGSAHASVPTEELTYRWRIKTRPFTSAATLAGAESSMTSLVPDVRGDYEVALQVFDGELWSTAAATVTFAAEP